VTPVNLSGAVLLSKPDGYEQHVRKQLTNLIRVGGKLAVLGVEEGARAAGWWHVCRPGTWNPPQGLNGAPDQQGTDLVHAKALCGRTVVSNGYQADWRPPVGTLCPACAEQL
jgi:hypothetical protein